MYKKHGTYTDDNFIYLVDLMFMYIKTITSTKIKLENILPQLKIKDWGNFSPIEVIKNKSVSPEDYKRIIKADLRYPIIITNDYKIIDGMHRLSKAVLLKKKYVRAYKIDDKTIEKFIISKRKGKEWTASDWNYYESLTKRDIDKLFKERFYS